ncbi:MAG: PQQ-binding-like beta-propeller repeat protein [Thaumarchaeota archaeon]|nr:PQQ-binding-like beta-propeller repeat protein [Nitrososphaerota archaeon]
MHRHSLLYASLVLVLIFGAAFIGTFIGANYAFGQRQQVDRGFSWAYPAYDKLATNFNPQTALTKDNIARVSDVWTTAFPIPPPIAGIEPLTGSSAMPIVVGGVVYFPVNYMTIFAHQAETGNPLWSYSYPVNMTDVVEKIPEIRPYQSGLLNGLSYYNGDIYMPLADCSIAILDALIGTPKFLGDLAQGRMCQNVPGNAGHYTGQMLYGPVFYEKGSMLITGTGVSGRADSGRGFVAGFDLTTGKLLWRFFLMPPAGGDPNWTIQYKGKGNVDPVAGDWGDSKGVGVGVGFGAWAVDEETGIVYVGTSAPAPYYDATGRPGPNLFSSSILALDAKTGELKWYYQTSSHDLAGHGCAWNVALGKIGDRKVVFKGCANGKVYALDAANGQLIWSFTPPSVKYVNVPSSSVNNNNKKWAVEPSIDAYWQCPGITGAIEGDIAVAYNKVYFVTYSFCDYLKPSSVNPSDLDSFGAQAVETPLEIVKNSTVYAIDASTGKMQWTFEIPDVPHRGGIIASGDMVFLGSIDGNIYALKSDTGEIAYKKFFGTPLGLPPTIAADAKGIVSMFQVVGGLQDRWNIPVSGIVVILKHKNAAIPPSAPAQQADQLGGSLQLPMDLLIPIMAVVVVLVLFGVLAMRRKNKK